MIFLDNFLDPQRLEKYYIRKIFTNEFRHIKNPLNKIDDSNILFWCKKDPSNRYSVIASTMRVFTKSDEEKDFDVGSLLLSVINNAPDKKDIFENLADTIIPGGGIGSRASLLSSRLSIFEKLSTNEDEKISLYAKEELDWLKQKVEEIRKWEEHIFHERETSFE